MATRDAATAIRRAQATIDQRGALTGSRLAYVQRNTARYGPSRRISPTRTLAARVAAAKGTPAPKSSVVVIGAAPEGFGKQVLWDPADASLAVIAFVAAGDPMA